MKSLLCSLLIISGLQIANAASTGTVTIPVFVPEPVIVITEQPVEAKVVEIHMAAKPVLLGGEDTKRKRKAENLPYTRRGTCSGSFINNRGDILTAKHCVEGFESFEVLTYDKRTYEAVVVATSPVHDLAMLHIDRRNTSFFTLANTLVRGETIFVLGSPLGITDTLSTGIAARLDGDVTLIDCSALPGNSGGPLFNKEQKLVGVLTAGMIVFFGTTHLNVAQGLDAVSFFLDYAAKKSNER